MGLKKSFGRWFGFDNEDIKSEQNVSEQIPDDANQPATDTHDDIPESTDEAISVDSRETIDKEDAVLAQDDASQSVETEKIIEKPSQKTGFFARLKAD